MIATLISRYDRGVQGITTRPNAAMIATGHGYQVLARRATSRKEFIVTYFVVRCESNDEDTVLASFLNDRDAAMAEYHRLTD